MLRIGVVISVYKAEECLEGLHCRLKAALEMIGFEILLIEDCGANKSWPRGELRRKSQLAQVKMLAAGE